MERRQFLAGAAMAIAPGTVISIDPTPRFEISPHLYMQFMEPLGVTDSSVEAAWDYDRADWRADFIDCVKDLAPGCVRWGGLYCRYYKWREGVGPVKQRPPMRNLVWGGWETNRVGTDEFLDFCARTGADPLMCVNFEGDGVARYGDRRGDAAEAADWVSYAKGRIKLWQLGNETSYNADAFGRDAAIEKTIEFARAMKQRDSSIKLIGWGDHGRSADRPLWAPELIRRAGEHIDYVAIHMMGQSPKRPDTVLRGLKWQRNLEQAWEELIEMSANIETRVAEIEQAIGSWPGKIAITEGHLSLPPHNANPILHEWLSGVFHARSMNIYQRHGAKVHIATAADFEGTRWTVNAVMLPVPGGRSYLMPVGSVMRLFGRWNGTHGVEVKRAPAGLDIAASRTGNKLYLHVANLEMKRGVRANLAIEGLKITGGTVREIAPDDIRTYVSADQPDALRPRDHRLPGSEWTFPAASVSVVELECASA